MFVDRYLETALSLDKCKGIEWSRMEDYMERRGDEDPETRFYKILDEPEGDFRLIAYKMGVEEPDVYVFSVHNSSGDITYSHSTTGKSLLKVAAALARSM